MIKARDLANAEVIVLLKMAGLQEAITPVGCLFRELLVA